MAETQARGGASASRRRVRRFFIALGALCLLATLFAALVLRGTIRLNTPSRADFPIWGVDVSHYQGDIDWETLAAQGVRFAYIKATEGSGHTDERFVENAQNAALAGVPAGGYHFFSFESAGKTQAENFLSALRDQPLSLPCAVDFEFYGEFFDHPPDVEATRAELRALLEALEAETGRKPVLYATSRPHRAVTACTCKARLTTIPSGYAMFTSGPRSPCPAGIGPSGSIRTRACWTAIRARSNT